MLLHERDFREKRNEKSRSCPVGMNEINLRVCREGAWRFDSKQRHIQVCALRQIAAVVAVAGVGRGEARCCVSV
jgi:hypothetical protein